jgi:predicted dehydrogenase
MNPISFNRILIVGRGSAGLRHLELSRQLFPNAETKILISQETNYNEKAIDPNLITIDQVSKFAPQIAIIANPATFHLEIAQELVKTGVHLLIEKPISSTTEGVQELIRSCKEKKVVLLTGYNLRYSASLNHFRDAINHKIVGKILSVRCEVGQYLPDWRPNKDYRFTVSANRHLGGGALLELSHEIDYLRWIFGEMDWVKATLSTQSSLDLDVEDYANLVVGFMPGIDGRQIIASVNLDFIRHDRTRSCIVIGETGTLKWNGLIGSVEIFDRTSENWKVLFVNNSDTDKSFIAEWENFIDSVNRKSKPLITGEDGLRVLEVVEAARKSSATGSQVLIKRARLLTQSAK